MAAEGFGGIAELDRHRLVPQGALILALEHFEVQVRAPRRANGHLEPAGAPATARRPITVVPAEMDRRHWA